MEKEKEVKGFVKMLWQLLIPLNENPKFQEKFKNDNLTFILNIWDGDYAALIKVIEGTVSVESIKNGDKKVMKELFKKYNCDGMLETNLGLLFEISQGNLSTGAMAKQILKKKLRVKGVKKVRILEMLFNFNVISHGINKETMVRDVILKWADYYGDKNFLTYVVDFDKGLDEKYTYKDMHTISNRFANSMINLGIGRGDGIALMNINSPEYLFTIFGAMKLGAYIVLVNTGLKGEGLKYILDHSDASSIVVHWSFLDSFLDIKDQLPNLKKIIVDLRNAPVDFNVPKGVEVIGFLNEVGTVIHGSVQRG